MNRMVSFIVGFAAGTALGMLVAPATGSETRKKIMEEADRMLDEALAYKQKIASRVTSKRSKVMQD